MKHYIIEPKTEKPIVERKFFQRTRDDGVVEMLEMETGWSWGSFMINVPETDEEIRDLLDERGTDSLAEFLKDHNADTLEQVLLPDPDDDVTLLSEDYYADVLDTYDRCWVVFNVSGKGLDEEQCEALSEEASEAYGDDGYEGLKNLGWQQGDVYYELHGEFELADFDTCIENANKLPREFELADFDICIENANKLPREFELADFDICIENANELPLHMIIELEERLGYMPDYLYEVFIEKLEIEGGNH